MPHHTLAPLPSFSYSPSMSKHCKTREYYSLLFTAKKYLTAGGKLLVINFVIFFRSSTKKTVYKEFFNKRTTSLIWEHFLRADNGQSVECKHCKKVLKTPGGATGALHTHLRAKHITELPQASTSKSSSLCC